MSRIPTAEEITSNWGERCPDYGEGCPCCEIWAMHDEIERLRKALERQGDNMAFVLNHHTMHDSWYEKFRHELDEDRAALDAIKEG
jgi:hypothetical protein